MAHPEPELFTPDPSPLYPSCPMRPLSFYPLVALLALSAGCAAAQGTDPDVPRVGSESQQSIAEYDMGKDLWVNRGNPREGLKRILHAIELDDENYQASHAAGLIYLDFCQRSPGECRLGDAEKHALDALDNKPDFREARNTLGVIYIHQKRYKKALETLIPLTRDILYQTPEIAWGTLGWAYLEDGDVERAIEALNRSTAAEPAFCVGSYRLGLAYLRKKDPKAALLAFDRALQTDYEACQGLQVAYLERARAKLQLKQKEGAKTDLTECVRLDEKSANGRECETLLAKVK